MTALRAPQTLDDTIRSLVAPRSVVVVGASSDPSRPSGRVASYLRTGGFAGDVYTVNPKHEEVQGFPCFPSIRDLPEVPDLAVLGVPAAAVPAALRQLSEIGVGAAISFASGFAEAGNDTLNRALVEALRDSGVRLLGPNCLGVVTTESGLTATFSSFLAHRTLRPGGITLLTQSGAVGNAILLGLTGYGVGIRSWVATGNEVDLDLIDFASYFVADDGTKAIVCFAESLRDAVRLVDVADRARRAGKALVVLKAGSAARSRSLAASHSGKMLGSHEAWAQFATYAGIVTPASLEQLVEVAHLAEQGSAEIRSGAAGIAVLCSSGGYGVLLADACERAGVRLADLSAETADGLRTCLPGGATLENPIDPTPVTDDAYFTALGHLVRDPAVHLALVIVNSLSREYDRLLDHLQLVARLAAEQATTLVVSYFTEADRLPAEQEQELRAAGCLVVPDPVRFIAALGRLQGSHGAPQIRPAVDGGPQDGSLLPWAAAARLLTEHGLPVTPWATVSSPADAERFHAEHAGPVVLKLDDPGVPHKSEVGGVRLGLSSAAELRAAFTALADARRTAQAQLIVQVEAEDGVDALVGCQRDPELGPLVTVGVGGTLTELIGDVVTRPCPVDRDEAERMVSGSKLGQLLAGYRGADSYDAGSLAEAIVAISRVFAEQAELIELECNPVIVHASGAGCTIVDILARHVSRATPEPRANANQATGGL